MIFEYTLILLTCVKQVLGLKDSEPYAAMIRGMYRSVCEQLAETGKAMDPDMLWYEHEIDQQELDVDWSSERWAAFIVHTAMDTLEGTHYDSWQQYVTAVVFRHIAYFRPRIDGTVDLSSLDIDTGNSLEQCPDEILFLLKAHQAATAAAQQD